MIHTSQTKWFLSSSTPIVVRHRDTGHVNVNELRELGDPSICTPWETIQTGFGALQTALPVDVDVWTDLGWCPVTRIVRQRMQHRLVLIQTDRGCFEATGGHPALSLSSSPGISPSPKYSLPKIPTPSCRGVDPPNVQEFGHCVRAQDEYLRLKVLGYDPRIQVCVHPISQRLVYIVKVPEAGSGRKAATDSATDSSPVRFVELHPCEPSGFVYNLETEEGVFQAGFGELLVEW